MPESPGKDVRAPSGKRRLSDLVALYEREAYTTYNLALRITCDENAAARATENAFLANFSKGDAEPLLSQTVTAALAEAPRGPSTEAETGPRQSKPTGKKARKLTGEILLAGSRSLAPSKRAALALISVGETSAAKVAKASGITTKAATALIRDAKRELGATTGVAANRVGPGLRDWPMEEPPVEIWESVYPNAHRIVAAKAPRRAGRTRSAAKRDVVPAWLGSIPAMREAGRVWAFRAAVLAIVLIPAAVVLLAGSSGDGPGNLALSATTPASAGSVSDSGGEDGEEYDALTPKELDQLRLNELDQLKVYLRRQADEGLSLDQRTAAAEQAQQLLALARQRLAEADRRERELAAREQQAGERPQRPASRPDGAAGPRPTGTGTDTGKKKKKKGKRRPKPAPSPPEPGDSISDCLYDEEQGTYICPE